MDFLIKIILFTLKIYFFTTKDAQSIVKIRFLVTCFSILSVIRRNFEYNLRIFANFPVKTQKSTDFAHMFSKNNCFFFGFFNKDCTFYTKNLVFATKDAQSIVKIRFLVTYFTFLSVIRQNFEYNKNFSQFSRKNSNIYDFAVHFQKTSFFLDFL